MLFFVFCVWLIGIGINVKIEEETGVRQQKGSRIREETTDRKINDQEEERKHRRGKEAGSLSFFSLLLSCYCYCLLALFIIFFIVLFCVRANGGSRTATSC